MPQVPRVVRGRAWLPLLVVVLVVAGCGSTSKPAGGRGQIDSPITTKTNHLKCLRKQNLPVQVVSPTALQIGSLPSGPTVHFEPTPGVAQGLQLQGDPSTQGAEVIGSALLYPNGASDGELKKIETCLSQNVSG